MDYYVGKFVVIEGVQEDADEDGWVPDQPALVIGTEQKVIITTPEKKIRTFTTKEYDPEFFDSEGNRLDGENPKMYMVIYKKSPDWENWYSGSTAMQVSKEKAEKYAESTLAYYKQQGWSEAIVKVAELNFL